MKSVFKLPSKKPDKDKPRAIDKMLEELKRCVTTSRFSCLAAVAHAQGTGVPALVEAYCRTWSSMMHYYLCCFEHAPPATNTRQAVQIILCRQQHRPDQRMRLRAAVPSV
jgi:hypothetical protein